MNPLEKLGLIRSINPGQPQASTEPSPSQEVPTSLPQVSVGSIDIEAAVNEIYAQGSFKPEQSIKRLREFISTLPESLPEATKQLTIGGILRASNIDINDLIDDGKARLDLIESAKRTAQADHENLCNEANAEIAKLEGYIEAAKSRMLESQQRTLSLTTAFDTELANLENLMGFAMGVVNLNNPIQPANG